MFSFTNPRHRFQAFFVTGKDLALRSASVYTNNTTMLYFAKKIVFAFTKPQQLIEFEGQWKSLQIERSYALHFVRSAHLKKLCCELCAEHIGGREEIFRVSGMAEAGVCMGLCGQLSCTFSGQPLVIEFHTFLAASCAPVCLMPPNRFTFNY